MRMPNDAHSLNAGDLGARVVCQFDLVTYNPRAGHDYSRIKIRDNVPYWNLILPPVYCKRCNS